MAALKALDHEFEPLPAPEKPHVVQLVAVNANLYCLTSDGRMFERGADPNMINQPFGPHFAWREIKGPVL